MVVQRFPPEVSTVAGSMYLTALLVDRLLGEDEGTCRRRQLLVRIFAIFQITLIDTAYHLSIHKSRKLSTTIHSSRKLSTNHANYLSTTRKSPAIIQYRHNNGDTKASTEAEAGTGATVFVRIGGSWDTIRNGSAKASGEMELERTFERTGTPWPRPRHSVLFIYRMILLSYL